MLIEEASMMPAKSKIFSIGPLLCLCLTLSACTRGSMETGGASDPAVVYDGTANRFFAVYVKHRSGEKNERRVSGRFVDSAGAATGSELAVSGDGSQYFCPSVAYDGLHQRFLVVWTGSDAVYGQLLNGDGTLHGQSFSVSGNAWSPGCSSAAYDDAQGSFLVAWGERHFSNIDSLNAQGITAEGVLAGPQILISETAAADVSPALVYDSINKNFFCTWESGGHGIRGGIINPDGSFSVPEFLISAASGFQYRPSAAHDTSNSRFLVTWEESDPDTGVYSLKGQVLNAGGGPFSSFLTISTGERNVLYHGSGYDTASQKYFIVYGDNTVSNERIYGQALISDGTADTSVSSGNLMQSHPDYPGDRRPALAYDAVNHRYFAAWSYGLTGSNYPDQQKYDDIHGRLVNADGTPASDILVLSNGGAW